MLTACPSCRAPRTSLADPYCRMCGALLGSPDPISATPGANPPLHTRAAWQPDAQDAVPVAFDPRADSRLQALAFRRQTGGNLDSSARARGQALTKGWMWASAALAVIAVAAGALAFVNY